MKTGTLGAKEKTYRETDTQGRTNQFNSFIQSCTTLCNPIPWTEAGQAASITNSQSLLKLVSIKLVMPSNHLAFNLCQHQGLFK